MKKANAVNPFTNRGMIRAPEYFFGRKAEINQIIQRLMSMQSVSVVGERRIGKSSLLYQVALKGKELGEDITVVYTDLPDVTDEQSFYRCLCRELRTEGEHFRDLRLALDGKKVILCLDEFERVIGQQAFPLSFFNGLRGLAQYGNLALVLATRQSLADLCFGENIATSNFWTIFYRINLGLLTDMEAETFIHKRFKAAGRAVTTEEVLRLKQLTGRYPSFLEIGCYHLYEMKMGRTSHWEDDFAAEVSEHMNYLWHKLNDKERKALKWMLELGGPLPDDRLIGDLERRGLVIQDHRSLRGYCPFSEVFDGVIQNPPSAKKPSKLKRLSRWFNGVKLILGRDPKIEAEFKRPEEKL